MTQVQLDDPILQAFLALLKENLGTRLREVWLLGSRARGDHDDRFRRFSGYCGIETDADMLHYTRGIVDRLCRDENTCVGSRCSVGTFRLP